MRSLEARSLAAAMLTAMTIKRKPIVVTSSWEQYFVWSLKVNTGDKWILKPCEQLVTSNVCLDQLGDLGQSGPSEGQRGNFSLQENITRTNARGTHDINAIISTAWKLALALTTDHLWLVTSCNLGVITPVQAPRGPGEPGDANMGR